MQDSPTIQAQRNVGNTGLAVHCLGFGCAPLGNLYRAITEAEAEAALSAAWEAGFRYFDTAPHYGQGLSERRLGDLLRRKRESGYILSTKVGRLLIRAGYAKERHGFHSPMPFDIRYDYSYDGILRSFEDSLQRLGLDRVDVLFMHDIGRATHGVDNDRHFPIAMTGGYKALDQLRHEGLVRAIGLGVNEYEVCEAAMNYGDWDCFLLAGRYTLLEQEALESFLPSCEQRGCSIIIGGPYNSGILATGTRGDATPHFDYGLAPPGVTAKVRAMEALCDEFRIPLAAAALQFPLAHPLVASIIPGLGTAGRVRQTLDLMQTKIPEDFWSALRRERLIRDDAPVPRGT